MKAPATLTDEALINIRPFPEASADGPVPEGMYILQRMPTGVIKPDAFVQGSREHLLKVTDRIKAIYGRGAPSVCSDWVSFMSQAPDTDDVQDWLKTNQFRVPLFDIAFSGLSCCFNVLLMQ